MLRKAPKREPIRASALAQRPLRRARAQASRVRHEAFAPGVRRQAGISSSGRHLLEELARDDEALDLGGALVDLGDSRVAVVALGRHLGHVPHATKHLDARVRVRSRRLGSGQLGHGRLLCVRRLSVLEVSRAMREQHRRLVPDGHVGEQELDRLVLGDGRVERLARLRVMRRRLERRARDAERLRRDANPPTVERRHGDLESGAERAEHRVLWDAAALEDEVARAGGSDAELVFLLAEGKAGRARLDEEGGEALMLERPVRRRNHDGRVRVVCVGDPRLCAL
mmetsp:Transcript_14879/g.50071  ORF Transcript_14879/g.50071 Transcript_14879/m.50071 type:complete len:283 (+) Transcript_14879:167-1015(+)